MIFYFNYFLATRQAQDCKLYLSLGPNCRYKTVAQFNTAGLQQNPLCRPVSLLAGLWPACKNTDCSPIVAGPIAWPKPVPAFFVCCVAARENLPPVPLNVFFVRTSYTKYEGTKTTMLLYLSDELHCKGLCQTKWTLLISRRRSKLVDLFLFPTVCFEFGATFHGDFGSIIGFRCTKVNMILNQPSLNAR